MLPGNRLVLGNRVIVGKRMIVGNRVVLGNRVKKGLLPGFLVANRLTQKNKILDFGFDVRNRVSDG